MTSPSWALQTALFAKLSADTGVKALLGDPPRLYDEVPRDAAFPYLILGDDRLASWNTATEQGSEHSLTLTLWSRARGRKESKTIAEAVRAALADASLTLTNHRLINLTFQSADFARQTDGRTWRASLRLRAVTEPL